MGERVEPCVDPVAAVPAREVHEEPLVAGLGLPASNFILVRTPDAKAAHAKLLAAGVLVRRQDHYAGLEGCIRVSVGTPAENDLLLSAALAGA